jgi:hypothetical protein
MASDPHSRRIATLRLVAQLEIQLKEHVSERKSCLDKAYLTPRESLQRAYEQTILNDWNAEDHDGESQMWKTCFYKPIEEWRRKIRAFTQVISDAQAKNDAKRLQTSIQEQSKTSTQFHAFLESSTGFYHNLLAKIRAKHGLSLDRSVLSSLGGMPVETSVGNDVASSTSSTGSKQASSHYRMTIFRILIRLGDLARYQRDLAGFPDADWQAAWAYYLDAQRLLPEQGMPYNQLAVLCSYSHDEIGALFFYARSLALTVPSETGKSNIEVHMRDASMKKYLEARRKYLEHVNAPKKARVIGDGKPASERTPTSYNAELWKVFVYGYFGLHNADSVADLERVQANLENLLVDFDQIVKSDHLLHHSPSAAPQSSSGYGSAAYMQLMIYNIFATWSVSTQFLESALSNESARLLLLRRLNLVMQFSLGMLNSLVERFVASIAAQANWMELEVSVTSAHAAAASSETNMSEMSIAKLEILPVIATYLHWLSTASTRLVSFDYSASFDRSCFDKLQKSLGTLMTAILPQARRHNQLMHRFPTRGAPPLPEDVELYPFLPLNAAFSDTNFSALCTVHDSEESYWRRCFKIAKFAQRIASDPLLVAATRSPIQDPLHHFASSTTPSNQADRSQNPSFSNFNGIFLFNSTQLGDIHGHMTLEADSSSLGAAPDASPQGPSQHSQTFPGFQASLSSPSHRHHLNDQGPNDASSENSLHSQDFLVTSSGMRPSQQAQPLPIGEHITKLPSPTFDHQSSLNSALDQLADAISMDLDSHAHFHHQIPSNAQNMSHRVSPIALGPPKVLFQDILMDSSDMRGIQEGTGVSVHSSSASPISPSKSSHHRRSHQDVIGEGRASPNKDKRTTSSNSSSHQEISDPPPGQFGQTHQQQTDDIQMRSGAEGYDPWGKFPTGASPSFPPFGTSQNSAPSPIAPSGMGNGMEIASEAPILMSNGAPTWNPFLISQFPSPSHILAAQTADPLHSFLVTQPQAPNVGRPLLFPGSSNSKQHPSGPS